MIVFLLFWYETCTWKEGQIGIQFLNYISLLYDFLVLWCFFIARKLLWKVRTLGGNKPAVDYSQNTVELG